MTQAAAPGGDDEAVDWDAVFRTIDHQQQPAAAAAGVARVDEQSGTGPGGDYRWPVEHQSLHHHHDHGYGDLDQQQQQDDSQAFLEHYARQLRQQPQPVSAPATTSEFGGPVHAESSNSASASASASAGGGAGSTRRRTRERESLVTPYSSYDRGTTSPYLQQPQQHDLPFRAMLRGMEGHDETHAGSSRQGHVPPPAPLQRGRIRRRSHSLALGTGTRRLASDSLPTVPLFTPQPNAYASHDGYPFTLPSPHPAQAGPQPGAPDFFALLSQVQTPNHPHAQNGFNSSTTTPAPTPLQTFLPYSNPPGSGSRPGSGAGSALATPAQSPPSATAAGGTPGAEADSEDKRVRNTLASARFRAKRKAHLAEVEQQITQLEGRSTTLQRQVEDLKKENAFLKEMVQLKYGLDVDKRMGK